MMNLVFIKSITWEEAFSSWMRGEANLPHWIEHYKERGFKSWEEWRKSSVQKLQPEKLKWSLYEIKNPLATVGNFCGGPFRAWKKKYYGDQDFMQFKDLAENQELQRDSRINDIIKNFPRESTLIGLRRGEEIIIIEGMHRCCALAIAYKKKLAIDVNLFIVLTDYPEEIPTLGQLNSPT